MTPADRARLEAQQAELLRSLIRGEDFPAEFDEAKADAASRSLRRKRARMVAGDWPAVAGGLGESFAARFDAFARTTPPPRFGFGYTDGLAFTRTLSDDELSDDMRVELLLARAVVTGSPGELRARRGAFLGAVMLRAPRRLVIVHRTPRLGRRVHVVALGRARRGRRPR